MKFVNINPTGGEWSWYSFGKSGFEAELKVPTNQDFKFVFPSRENSDPEITRQEICKRLFRDFRGAADGAGKVIPNTLQNRIAILDHFGLWKWMQEKLVEIAKSADEGNAEAASD